MSLIDRSRRNNPSLSTEEAITKFKTTVETINLREGVKPHERKRIEEAFEMLVYASKASSEKTDQRRKAYQSFLRKVNSICGPQSVVVSAVAIGLSGIAGMKEHNRLRLPLEIKKLESPLDSSVLQKLVEECAVKDMRTDVGIEASISLEASQQTNGIPTDQSALASHKQSLSQNQDYHTLPLDIGGSNRVFELTLEDVQSIVTSGQVIGRVFLMEPYRMQTLPFITITLSEELCGYFTAQRHRVE